MISNQEKIQKIIEEGTSTQMIFTLIQKKAKHPTITHQSNIMLPSQYQFKSSQQIENNCSISHQYQSSQDVIQNINSKQWSQSCIGLILCEHYQNNQTLYVYGTGVLIHNNIVVTGARNIYCHRLKKQYINIKFITNLNGNKCSGIYHTKCIHYPIEYITQEEYDDYDFAILQLYNDLSNKCGYVGLKSEDQTTDIILYEYIRNSSQQILINLRKLNKDYISIKSNVMLVKDQEDEYYMIGIQNRYLNTDHRILTTKIKDHLNDWTKFSKINLAYKFLKTQLCEYLVKQTYYDLKVLDLTYNNIGAGGCNVLMQSNWKFLTAINLYQNNINDEGCKHLKQADWPHLNIINLTNNNITAEGVKHLKQANWKYLSQINLCISLNMLVYNFIGDTGCKYLSQSNWVHLQTINLCTKGCSYLILANWPFISTIILDHNQIGAQGCKHLNQSNWKYLVTLSLCCNNIKAEGCKYLKQTNWKFLNSVNLRQNDIGLEGCKYLRQVNWTSMTIYLQNNNIVNDMGQSLFKEKCCMINI